MGSCPSGFGQDAFKKLHDLFVCHCFPLIPQACGGRAPLLVTDFADPLTIARQAGLFLRRKAFSAFPVKIPCMERNRSRAKDRLSFDFLDSRASHLATR